VNEDRLAPRSMRVIEASIVPSDRRCFCNPANDDEPRRGGGSPCAIPAGADGRFTAGNALGNCGPLALGGRKTGPVAPRNGAVFPPRICGRPPPRPGMPGGPRPGMLGNEGRASDPLSWRPSEPGTRGAPGSAGIDGRDGMFGKLGRLAGSDGTDPLGTAVGSGLATPGTETEFLDSGAIGRDRVLP